MVLRRRMAIKASMLAIACMLFLLGCGGGSPSPAGEKSGGAVSPGGSPASDQKQVKWDYYVFVGLTHPIGQYAQEFAETVKERTGGQLQITIRPAGELPFKATEVIRVVGQGQVQLGDALAGFVAGDSAIASVAGLPFLIRTPEDMEKAITAVRPFLEKDLEKHGASILFWYTWPQQNIWGRGEPVRSLADLKGRSIRGTTPEEADMIRSLGGTPVTLTTEEVPTAMQRGVIDGLISAAFNVLGARWYEFIDWAYVPEIRLTPSYILVNEEALAALPPEVRKALEDTAAEFQARMLTEVMQQENDARKALADQHGIEFYEASQEDVRTMEDMMGRYWDEWAQKAGPDVVEALQAVRQATGR